VLTWYAHTTDLCSCIVVLGVLLTLAAAAMIYWEDALIAKQKAGTLSEIPSMAFGGRYVMVMMGSFAVYCGIIYNDCLSIPTNVYGSAWTDDVTVATTGKMINPTGWTYPCGVDPVWSHKVNELAFMNSLKMKMAVILGVCHMLFGIVLSLFNHLYFKDYLSVYWEFIPKFIFMLSTFGYMIWMVLYKWCQDWDIRGNPPNLIQTMIAMFLSPGSIDPDKQLYEGQAGFQSFLLLCAFFSVPAMLFVKPYLNKKKHEAAAITRLLQQQQADRGAFSEIKEDDIDEHKSAEMIRPPSPVAADGHGGHGEYDFSDEMIHQGIHTIEFVLGAVSNTASYLRLWALSLAHAQLSAVFWEKMIMQYGALSYNAFICFIGFSIWCASTFAVLLCMDVLECFLHALRLHWVEFQNKFYYADGSDDNAHTHTHMGVRRYDEYMSCDWFIC
jgi:V-type H+-transporting ATPase subunit a